MKQPLLWKVFPKPGKSDPFRGSDNGLLMGQQGSCGHIAFNGLLADELRRSDPQYSRSEVAQPDPAPSCLALRCL